MSVDCRRCRTEHKTDNRESIAEGRGVCFQLCEGEWSTSGHCRPQSQHHVCRNLGLAID